jgi:CBS domain-containing protein
VTASPDDSIEDAARRMAQEDVGALPVCEGRKVIGIVTDRDIVVRGLAKGLDAKATVRDVMTDRLETVSESDDIEDVHDRMSAAQVRRLPVVDESGELVGMIALADVARVAESQEAGATLEEISEPVAGESRSFQEDDRA